MRGTSSCVGAVDPAQHLDLLVAHLLRGEVDGRLHRDVAQQLEHVVLNEVAQRADRVVVLGARADADVFGRGDLHLLDVVAVPPGLEHAVGEAERQQVLDRLLAEVVVDPVDLGLVEHRQQLAVELLRARQGGAERLLDHDAHLGVIVAMKAVVTELADDIGKKRARSRDRSTRFSGRPASSSKSASAPLSARTPAPGRTEPER